jgi:hypothetical protein
MRGGNPEDIGDSMAEPVAGITENHHASIIPDYPSWRNRPGSSIDVQPRLTFVWLTDPTTQT